MKVCALIVIMAALTPMSQAQNRNQPPAADPSGVIGAIRRDAAAANEPTPRLKDGTVNLGRPHGERGIWGLPVIANFAQYAEGVPQGFRGNLRAGAAAEPHIPFQPWSAAVYNYNSASLSKFDPEGYCLPPGGPRLMATPFPMEVIQLPEEQRIFMVYEGGTHIWREIYMDGRPHPKLDSLESGTYLGHSVGRWEGDTLVVDAIGFNDKTWLAGTGTFHSDKLHVVEKFTRKDENTIAYEVTMEDPVVLTKPWTLQSTLMLRPGTRLREYECVENNTDLDRYEKLLKDESVFRRK